MVKKNFIGDAKEVICVIIYGTPMNIKKISDELYNKRNTKVSTYKEELKNNGWIREIDYYERIKDKNGRFKKGTIKDKRESYYITTTKCLIDKINEYVGGLKRSEMEKLDVLFSSDGFKIFMKNFSSKKPYQGLDRVIFSIGLFSVYADILLADFKNTTGLKSYVVKKWYIDYFNDPSIQRQLLSDLTSDFNTRSKNEPVKANPAVMPLILDYIGLGSDLIRKLAGIYGDSRILYDTANICLSMANIVKIKSRDPEVIKAINTANRV